MIIIIAISIDNDDDDDSGGDKCNADNDDDDEIDNGLFSPPPPLAPIEPPRTNGNAYNNNNNNGSEGSPDTSMESIQTSTQTTPVAHPRMCTTPTQTNTDVLAKELEKQDIYKEAFESTKRTEEAKFKVRFDNLLQDMQQSFENLSPRDGQVLSGYGSTSYGDLMTTYRGRVKDLLVSLSQRLELAVESFDETCAHNPSLTSQKVKQMISKLVEDRLGESLDLVCTSDEAVSDLSSLSDDSGEQKSLEDQIAQAVIARVLEMHRTHTGVHLDLDEPINRKNSDSSGSEVKTVVRSRGSSMNEEPNVLENGPNDHLSPKSAKLQESGNKMNEKSDINANIQPERAKWAKNSQPLSGEEGFYSELGDDIVDGENAIDNDENDIDTSGRLSSRDTDDDDDDETFQSGTVTNSGKKRKRQSSSESDGHRPVPSSRNSANRSKSESEDMCESDEGLRPRLGSSYCEEKDGKEDMVILQQEFQKLRTFAKEIVPKPLYEEASFVEEIEPEPIEEQIECTTIDHNESQEEFESRFFTYDKVHDTDNRNYPDFSDLDYEYHDFGVNEVDPDLLSMNLAPILEETEEELAEEEDYDDDDNDDEEDKRKDGDWRGNWLFKGALGNVNSYDSLNKSKTTVEFGDGSIMVPRPIEILAPQIGNRDVDDMSDLSENEDRDLSDQENSFYSKTSEEIARITRKTPSISTQASAIQTDFESDGESVISRGYSSFSDSGFRGAKVDQSFDSRISEKLKLSEELIPAEGDDPKFEIPPDSVTIAEGEPAKLTCRVAGTQPVDVFWYKVGAELEELENSENYEIIKDGFRHYLNMYNMTLQDGGQYMCMCINEKGNSSQYFILKVKKNTMELKTPEFLREITDVEVKEGQSVKFRCKVKGIPQPRVVWYKDGQIIMNQLNYRLERFGNRDYILAIDCATMDEDAEYCVLAKNISGVARSSAQLIVEPKNKPESVPVTAKSPKGEKTKEKPKSENEFPDLSYLGIGRSKSTTKASNSSTSSVFKTPGEKKESSDTVPKSPKDTTDSPDLHNLSETLTKTKESVSDVAEDMLSSTKEQDGAKNVRNMTESTLDYLNGADSVIMRGKGSGAMATSTPRSSDTERVFNPDSDNSHFVCDTSDVTMETPLDTSDDSHKSEIVFKLNPMTVNLDSAKDAKPRVKTGRRSYSRSSSNEEDRASKNQTESQNKDKPSSSDTSQTTYSPNVSMETSDLNTSHHSLDSNSSEPIRVNLGPKRENKEPYQRDFYIVDTPQLPRKTPPTSPRDVKQTAHTEEKIYLATSAVSHLDNKVQSLQDKMRAVQLLQEQDKLTQIENQVAQTVAQVNTTEKQVKDIEKSVNKLTEPQTVRGTSNKSYQAPCSPPPQRPITPPRAITPPKPEPTFLKGDTKEQDIPESRSEYNEEYGSIELPSVNRLKAMFGGVKEDKNKDSSIKRIHSITARSVPKEQLEKLRQTSEDHPHARVAMTTSKPSEPTQTGRATALTTGQQIKTTPNMPKQVYQSHDFNKPSVNMVSSSSNVKMAAPPKQSIQISSNTKPTSADSKNTKAQTTMKISLGGGNVNRPISPDVTTSEPIKNSVTSNIQSSKSNSQSGASNVSMNQSDASIKTGNEIDTPEERKSPKIKSGAISAMSKFWENRSQGVKDDAPDILEYE
ncbi:hypothetical protein ACF0H5_023608 [Mactra antiquata]